MQQSDNKEMRTCSRDASHLYLNELASCPFCALEPAVQKPLPPSAPIPSQHWASGREDPAPSPQAQLQSRNIFKKTLHLDLLARLKVLILLAFVIAAGCLVAFVRSFYEFVFGGPLLHPHVFNMFFTVLIIILLWYSLLSSLDKGEPEQGRAKEPEWLLIAALFLPLLGLWLITPIAPSPSGIPEKRGTQYVLMHNWRPKDSKSDLIRDLSKEEYELISRYYVRRNAFGWMIFHGMLIIYLLSWYYKIINGHSIPLKALLPHQMNIQQAILTLRADSRNTQTWLQLGWMLAGEGEAQYASDCYQRALSLNLSKQPTAAVLLPSWLNSSPIMGQKNDSISLPSWFDEYQSGVSLFSLLRTAYLSPLIWVASLPAAFLFCIPLLISYRKDGAVSLVLLLFLLLLFGAIMALMVIRFLAEVLKILKFYLSHHSLPMTEAMVMGSLLRLYYSKKRYYKLHLIVVYKADGKAFYSTPSLQNKTFESLQTARTLQDEWNDFGKRIRVFYHPSRPEVIALSKAKFHWNHTSEVLFMFIFLLLYISLIYLMFFEIFKNISM